MVRCSINTYFYKFLQRAKVPYKPLMQTVSIFSYLVLYESKLGTLYSLTSHSTYLIFYMLMPIGVRKPL